MVKFRGVVRGGRGGEGGKGGRKGRGGRGEGGLLLREAVICGPWRPLFSARSVGEGGKRGRQTFGVCSVRTRFVVGRGRWRVERGGEGMRSRVWEMRIWCWMGYGQGD